MNNHRAALITLLLLILSCMSISKCSAQFSNQKVGDFVPRRSPKYIILFIGDGMGLTQVSSSLARSYGQQLEENGEPPKFSFEQFLVFGYLTTFSSSSFVTDSAAAGTALACGTKTNNGVLGLDPEGIRVTSIAEVAKQAGMAVGIISSVGLNHATPAAFYAHVPSRSMYDDILEQFFTNQTVDVLIGGGVYGTWTAEQIEQRAAETGYQVYTCDNLEMFNPSNVGTGKVFGYFDTNNNHQLDYEATRAPDNPEPHLSDLTVTTLDILSRDGKGFFLMVEGGAIDWACHANNAVQSDGEVKEFHNTIERTVQFLESKGILEKTLIVVTADHETGGMGLNGPYGDVLLPGDGATMGWTTANHTAMPVPVWSQGPDSELFAGKHDNTFISSAIKSRLNNFITSSSVPVGVRPRFRTGFY